MCLDHGKFLFRLCNFVPFVLLLLNILLQIFIHEKKPYTSPICKTVFTIGMFSHRELVAGRATVSMWRKGCVITK